MRIIIALAALAMGAAAPLYAQSPIIDVHLHALPADAQAPAGTSICAPFQTMPTWDNSKPYLPTFMQQVHNPECPSAISGPPTDLDLQAETLAILDEYNIIGVASGPPEYVAKWREAAPDRIIPGVLLDFSQNRIELDEIRSMFEAGALEVLGEVTIQYDGVTPDDPRMRPYWALAAELGMPVGIHMGPGPPGTPYLGTGYLASVGDPLLLEPILTRHPDLRLYVMHAGFPMAEHTRALMYTHPQVYVGLGVISFTQPTEVFHGFLCELVGAGFGKRIMFGSDQMQWPGAIIRAIDAVEAAPCLSEKQERDILYNNAARFLRLGEDVIARHHKLGE